MEDALETMGAGESLEWSSSSLDQLQASVGLNLEHQEINGLEEYICHPEGHNTNSKQSALSGFKQETGLKAYSVV